MKQGSDNAPNGQPRNARQWFESTLSKGIGEITRRFNLDGVFPVEASVLSGDALASLVLPKYGFKGNILCRFQGKELNDLYRVTVVDSAERHFFRVYRHGFWEAQEIAAEMQILKFLNRAGIGSAEPMVDRDGEVLQVFKCPEGERLGVLFRGMGGNHPRVWDAKLCEQFGTELAKMHKTLDQGSNEWCRPIMNSTFTALRSIERARPYFGGRTEDFEFLETTARGLAHHMDTVPRYQHGFGVVHGDLHEFNVLVSANRINFIDFDLCGYAPRAYDLASFVWGRLFVSKDDVATMSTHFDAMIEGYRKEIDFPDSEKDRVAACLVFREIFRIGLDCDGPAAWGYRWLTAESWNNSLLFLRNWVKEHPYLFAHA